MNTRGVVLVALLLVLAVALWGAIYYGVPSGGNHSGPSSSGFNEFSASFQITEDSWPAYTGSVYSKMTWVGSNPTWTLEGQVDYTQGTRHFRHVYNKGYVVYGEIVDNGDFNISYCDYLETNKILDTSLNTFVPEPIENAKAGLLATLCPACQAWRLVLADNTFLMLEQTGDVKYLQSWDKVIEVTSFTKNAKTYSAPVDPRNLPQCDFLTDVPDAANNTLVEPLSANQFQPMEADRVTEEPIRPQATNPVTMYHYRIDTTLEAGSNSPLQRHLSTLAEKAAASTMSVSANPDAKDSSMKPLAACDWKHVGDGYCDPSCNNQGYLYDGGDCCSGCCKAGRKYPCGSNKYNCIYGCNAKPCLFLHGLGQDGDGSFGTRNPPGHTEFGHPYYWGDMASILSGSCSYISFSWANTNGYSWSDPNLYTPYYNLAQQTVAAGGVVFAHSMANPIMGGACLVGGLCDVKWYMIGGPLRGSAAASFQNWIYKIFGFSTNTGTNSLLNSAWAMKSGSNRDALSRIVHTKGLLKGALCGKRPWGAGGISGIALYAVGAAVYGGWECDTRILGLCVSSTLYGSDGLVGIDECQQYGYQNGNSWSTWFTQGNVWKTDKSSPFFMSNVNHYDETFNTGDQDGVITWARNMVKRG